MKKKKEGSKKKDTESSQEKNQHKESELEEEVSKEEESKQIEIIEDNEFHEFIQSSNESFTPILEKIETLQQESLEQNVGSAPIVQEKKDEKSKDYSPTSNEPNYSSSEKIKYQTNTGPGILKPREISEDLPRQGLLEPRIRTQNNLRPTMIDTKVIEEKTRLPFEKDDKKYKEFRF